MKSDFIKDVLKAIGRYNLSMRAKEKKTSLQNICGRQPNKNVQNLEDSRPGCVYVFMSMDF